MVNPLTIAGGRLGIRDIAVAAFFCVGSVFFMVPDVRADAYGSSAIAVPFFALIFVPAAWRRVAALAAIGATTVLLLGHIAVFGETVRCGIVLPFVLVLVFSVGAQLDWQRSFAGLTLALVCDVAICFFDGPEGAEPLALTFLVPVTIAIWGAGCLVRSRGKVAGRLAAKTAELREARDRRARLEVSTDRARVSAELDELLRRRLGELAAMAEAGGEATDPTAAAAALQEIEVESRRTLEQMRTVVGVLRAEAGGDAPRAPQPTLTHLDALLLRARGSEARLTVEGSPRALPAGVELSAYRIVEHLLDALEDAPADVAIRFGDDALELIVSGPSRRPNAAAIQRAQERVQLHRGTLRSSTRGGRAESVASLPMLAGA